MNVEVGKSYRFDYPSGFTTLPDYSAHRGQTVTVLRQLTPDECDDECQPMYKVQAADGWSGDADGSELTEL